MNLHPLWTFALLLRDATQDYMDAKGSMQRIEKATRYFEAARRAYARGNTRKLAALESVALAELTAN